MVTCMWGRKFIKVADRAGDDQSIPELAQVGANRPLSPTSLEES
jgi:hypothetical protein